VSTRTGCTCTAVVTPEEAIVGGTYTTTAAGLLTETGPTDVSLSDYCVKGTTLTISPHPGSAMAGQSDLLSTITATKQ
jgi:hypothetical protein